MLSNMKVSRNIIVLLIMALGLSCSGTVDETSLPVLEASDTEIDMAEETSVEFTVTYQGVDVTSVSEIYLEGETSPAGPSFAPAECGKYVFHALYDGKKSAPVTVTVTDSKPQLVSKYDRHVCLMDFTGAWCVNCPAGYDNMMLTLSRRDFEKYKKNIHICAMHSTNGGSKDPMAIDASDDVRALFGTLDFPSYAVDLRRAGSLTSEGMSSLSQNLFSSFEEYPSHCGVAVSSAVKGSEAEVTVKLASEQTTAYRVVVMVVEDRITSPQKTPVYPGTDERYPDGDPDFVHRHVVREVVTSYKSRFTGEMITDDGIIASGEEKSKTWTVSLDSEWNLENTEIYALALDADGYVNNMNVCDINGGDSGYDTEITK